jgi:O-antigen/teichoic acid export membrane protein
MTKTPQARGFKVLLLGDRYFLATRALSLLLALSFALVYSIQLGVERRGLLTFIMSTNLVFSVLLISGLSLHIRNISRIDFKIEKLGNYLSLIFIFSLITPVLNLVAFQVWESAYQTAIANNLVLVSLIYCFFSTLSFGLHDALLLIKSVKVAAILDVSTVVLQILGYAVLVYTGETSYFVAVLIALSVSYLVMTFSTFILLLYNFNPPLKFSLSNSLGLIKESRAIYIISIASGIIERIDKVFLGIQTSAGELGRYSTNQSVLAVSKFLPDTISKLSLARNRNYLSIKSFSIRLIALFLFGLAVTVWLTYQLVERVLGVEWTLPALVFLSLVSIELLRGIYSVITTNALGRNQEQKLKRVSYYQLFIAIVIQPISISFFGTAGALICNLILLSLGILFFRKYISE